MWQRRDVSSFVVIVSLLAEEVDDQTLTTEEKMMMVQLPSVRVAVVVLPFAPKKKNTSTSSPAIPKNGIRQL
jgi:hypothetical protein